MPARVLLSFQTGDFTGFDDSTGIPVTITEFDQAIITAGVLLLYNRNVWESMSDNDWDAFEAKLSTVLEAMQ